MKKNNVTKVLSLVLSAMLLTGVCTSCNKSTNDKDEQGRTMISIGGYPSTEGTNKDNWDARWQKFEQDNTDVVITPDQWTFDLKSFYTKAAGGQLPTLFGTHFTEIKQCIEAEYVADITDTLNARGYEGKFNEKIVDLISQDGKIYAFPINAYVLGMGYNTEMFEKAGLMEADGTPKQPKDWDEVVEFAKKIKEATGKAGFVFPTANNNGGWMFTCLAWSFGADFMEQDADGKWKATFNSPEAVAALQWIKDLKWKHDVIPSNTLIDGTEYYKVFATGNAGMLMAAGDYTRKLTQYGMVPDQVGMMALPAGPKRHVTLLGGSIFSVSAEATEDQKDAAIRWLETSYNYNATEDFKTNKQKDMDKKLGENQLIGIKSMSVWNDDVESVVYENQLIDENTNANINHVRLYNEFVNSDVEIQPEEPVCTQELYGVLDGCIQEVLANKDADCAELLEKAVSDFQANYLDNLDY